MLTNKDKKTFLKIIPKKQICMSWSNLPNLIQQLDYISNNRFDLKFIQIQCHQGIKAAHIHFEGKIQSLEIENKEDLAIDDNLLSINEWLQTNDLLPQNFCFDKVQFPDGIIAICFFYKFSKAQLLREGLANKLCYLGKNWRQIILSLKMYCMKLLRINR